MTDSEWRAVIEARIANLERMCGVERDRGAEEIARAVVALNAAQKRSWAHLKELVAPYAEQSRLAPAAGDVRDHLLQGFERDPEAKA